MPITTETRHSIAFIRELYVKSRASGRGVCKLDDRILTFVICLE
jgi:hypothetical protein